MQTHTNITEMMHLSSTRATLKKESKTERWLYFSQMWCHAVSRQYNV